MFSAVIFLLAALDNYHGHVYLRIRPAPARRLFSHSTHGFYKTGKTNQRATTGIQHELERI